MVSRKDVVAFQFTFCEFQKTEWILHVFDAGVKGGGYKMSTNGRRFMKKSVMITCLAGMVSAALRGQAPIPITPYQVLDSRAGQVIPCVGCQVFTYSAGTSTPLPTYTDSTLGTPNTNPVLTNAAGYTVNGSTLVGVWVGIGTCYKFVLEDANSVTIWTQDHICGGVSVSSILGGAATQIQFNNGGTSFGGSANFTWNSSTNTLNITGSQNIGGNITETGDLTISSGALFLDSSSVAFPVDNISVIGSLTNQPSVIYSRVIHSQLIEIPTVTAGVDTGSHWSLSSPFTCCLVLHDPSGHTILDNVVIGDHSVQWVMYGYLLPGDSTAADRTLGNSSFPWSSLFLDTNIQMGGTIVLDSSRNLTNIVDVGANTYHAGGTAGITSATCTAWKAGLCVTP